MIRKELSRLPTPTSILDAGCGLGYTVADIQDFRKVAAVTGLDFSQTAIDWAVAKFPTAEWICADLTQLNLDRTFQVVVCTEVIEHIDRFDLVLSNLVQIIEPEGFLLLTTQSGKVHETERSVGHIRHFSTDELIQQLESRGMEVVRSKQWGWPGMTLLKYLANLKPESTIERFGSGEYSFAARIINHLAYVLARCLSLPSSRLGCQIILIGKRTSER